MAKEKTKATTKKSAAPEKISKRGRRVTAPEDRDLLRTKVGGGHPYQIWFTRKEWLELLNRASEADSIAEYIRDCLGFGDTEAPI